MEGLWGSELQMEFTADKSVVKITDYFTHLYEVWEGVHGEKG
jgi:hypothetical protein